MRIILHGGVGGGAQLLKEVTIMRKKTPNADGTYDQVLVTDDTQIPHFGGVIRRGDKLVGQRISSPFFQFEGNQLSLGGSISLGGNLGGTLELPAEHPTNPFRHRYHKNLKPGRKIDRVISDRLHRRRRGRGHPTNPPRARGSTAFTPKRSPVWFMTTRLRMALLSKEPSTSGSSAPSQRSTRVPEPDESIEETLVDLIS